MRYQAHLKSALSFILQPISPLPFLGSLRLKCFWVPWAGTWLVATSTKWRGGLLAGAFGMFVLLSTTAAFAQRLETEQPRATAVDETFESLESWEALRFRGIDRLTHYEAVREGGKPLLLVASNDSGSGIVHDQIFNVYDYSALEWQWRVENIVRSGDLATRAGDNFAIRVYVLFEYDPSKVGPATRLLYSALRAFYGEYPPYRSLVYVWGNLQRETRWYPNAYTSRAMMLPVDQGGTHLLQWRHHTRNIVEDYYEAFGEEPPENARIAIMGDADGSGERTRAWIEYIRVREYDDLLATAELGFLVLPYPCCRCTGSTCTAPGRSRRGRVPSW